MLNFSAMTTLRQLIATLILLSSACFAQVAPLSSIWTAGGFLDVCGRPDEALSKEQLDAVKSVPPSQSMDKLKEVTADRIAEIRMCFAYLSGLSQGWKAGHEHGVAAAQFPEGWPKDEEKAVKSLPPKQLQAALTAMSSDVPCIPDYVTIGQHRDIVVKYIRDQEKQGNPFMGVALSSRIVYLAFQAAFPCAAQPPKPPDAVK
jgi:hypothetical protein